MGRTILWTGVPYWINRKEENTIWASAITFLHFLPRDTIPANHFKFPKDVFPNNLYPLKLSAQIKWDGAGGGRKEKKEKERRKRFALSKTNKRNNIWENVAQTNAMIALSTHNLKLLLFYASYLGTALDISYLLRILI